MNYPDFIKGKLDYGSRSGFEPLWLPDFLFDFQEYLVDWAIKKGRAAIFADCGMGKTPMQLVWAQNVVQKTNKPVLILTPLAVSGQTLEESEKFGIEAHRAHPSKNPIAIQVTNYEQLHKYDSSQYGGVVCDESSILKNYKGKRKAEITGFMRTILYRLLCTATAAPNDLDELGTSSEALGYYGHQDMIDKFFTNKLKSAALMRGRFSRDKWKLRRYAEEAFWRWVSSWARACRKPSDLGFDDDGFILPPLEEMDIVVQANRPAEGMLFDLEAITFHEIREMTKRTIQERCETVAERVAQNGNISMVWCHLNPEGDLLDKLIPNSVQVAGRHPEEQREEAIKWFAQGADEKRVMISKPKIFGFGLNLQHCSHTTYFPTDSYEQYYQCIRRLWRFGQEKRVRVERIYTNGGQRMLDNIDRKANQASKMFDELVKHMGKELHLERTYTEREVGVPQWMK